MKTAPNSVKKEIFNFLKMYTFSFLFSYENYVMASVRKLAQRRGNIRGFRSYPLCLEDSGLHRLKLNG